MHTHTHFTPLWNCQLTADDKVAVDGLPPRQGDANVCSSQTRTRCALLAVLSGLCADFACGPAASTQLHNMDRQNSRDYYYIGEMCRTLTLRPADGENRKQKELRTCPCLEASTAALQLSGDTAVMSSSSSSSFVAVVVKSDRNAIPDAVVGQSISL